LKTEDDIMHAIATAMNAEYKAIVDSGLLGQLDDARLAVTYDRMVPPGDLADYLTWVAKQVELINYSLRGIPEDRVRYHVCWGSWNGPHTTDVPLRAIIDEHIRASGFRRLRQLQTQLARGRIRWIQINNQHLPRRNVPRPNDAIIIITLFNDRLERAADANAVAPHDHRVRLLFIIGINGSKFF
jgi:hypothetical protein